MNRMFGVGSIAISSSGQSFEIFIKGVEDPYKAKAIIDQNPKAAKSAMHAHIESSLKRFVPKAAAAQK